MGRPSHSSASLSSWESDKIETQAKIVDLTAVLEREKTLLGQAKSEISTHVDHASKMKTLLNEYSQQNIELQAEMKPGP
jgi:hypothetical protein